MKWAVIHYAGEGVVYPRPQKSVMAHGIRSVSTKRGKVSVFVGLLAFLMVRALEDSNPRHPVLETDVLPTELRTHHYNHITWSDADAQAIDLSRRTSKPSYVC